MAGLRDLGKDRNKNEDNGAASSSTADYVVEVDKAG